MALLLRTARSNARRAAWSALLAGAAAQRSASSSTAIATSDAFTVAYLRNLNNGADVYLVGTAHVSQESAREVERVIRHVQPTTIFVELCPERAAAMRAGQTKKMGDTLSKVMRALGVPEALASGAAGLLSGLRLMDMEAGAEFRSALRLADELRARVVLGDRPAAETLRRLAGAVSFADLARMAVPGLGPPPPPELVALQAAGSVEAAVERMKNRRVVKALTEHMRATVPGAMRVMLDERDAIMADALARCEGPRVVGVVGLAHLEGIERRWADAAAAAAAQRALPRGGGGGGG